MAHSWFSAVHNLNLNWKYSLCSKLWSYTSRNTSIQAFSPARVLDTQYPVSLNGTFFITVVYQNQEMDIVPSTNFIQTSPIHTYAVVSVGACVCIVLCFFFNGCTESFFAAHGLSLVLVSQGYSSLLWVGFSSWSLLLMWTMGSRGLGLSSCTTQAK